MSLRLRFLRQEGDLDRLISLASYEVHIGTLDHDLEDIGGGDGVVLRLFRAAHRGQERRREGLDGFGDRDRHRRRVSLADGAGEDTAIELQRTVHVGQGRLRRCRHLLVGIGQVGNLCEDASLAVGVGNQVRRCPEVANPAVGLIVLRSLDAMVGHRRAASRTAQACEDERGGQLAAQHSDEECPPEARADQ